MNSPTPSLPSWLEDLRRAEVLAKVGEDPRSGPGSFLGVDQETALECVTGWGQADFDVPWNDLAPDDRALLYAYFMQRGHLQELLTAFRALFGESAPASLVVIDLGCGPFTGGLALAAALGAQCRFNYIGVDRSSSMRRLGERLAGALGRFHPGVVMGSQWVREPQEVQWNRPPQWPPVLVIVSYLLASPTLDPQVLVKTLNQLLVKIGRGVVTVLYTNSDKPGPNKRYPELKNTLMNLGFEVNVEGSSTLDANRDSGASYERAVRYALFHRSEQRTLVLD